jgi:YD repeat-containing protein
MPQNLVIDAKLNKDSYYSNNRTGGVLNADGWVCFKVTEYKPAAGTNFAAQLYQGPDGSYKIAYRGTVDPLGAGDKAMNAGIVAGHWTAEMSESINFTFKAIKQIQLLEPGLSFEDAKARLTVTGHSQGGFEAELNAKFFGVGGTSIDGPGAAPLVGVAGWNAMKEWARAQEPGVQQNYDIGDFTARRYTLLVGGVNLHVGGGGMVVDNATASLFLQTGAMFTTPLGAAVSLGAQGLYLHKIDNIIALEELRQQQPWLQKIVDANDPASTPFQVAWDISSKWAQVQVGGPGGPVSADDVQAIVVGFLSGRGGQAIAVQEYNRSVRIQASNGDVLTLFSDGSGVKVEGHGIAIVQTEYTLGGQVLASSSVQVDDNGNTLVSRSGQGFSSTYTLDTTGQVIMADLKVFDAANQLQGQTFFTRNVNGTTTAMVYNNSGQLQSTTNSQVFDDGSRVELTIFPNGQVVQKSFDIDGQLAGTITDTPDGSGGINRVVSTMVDGKPVEITQHIDATKAAVDSDLDGNMVDAGEADTTNLTIGGQDAVNSDLLENAIDATYVSAIDIIRARGTGELGQYMAAGDLANLDGIRDATTTPGTPWTIPSEVQRLGASLTSIQGLIAALKSGNGLGIATSSFNTLEALTGGVDGTLEDIGAGLNGATAILGLKGALERGDMLSAVSSGLTISKMALTVYQSTLSTQAASLAGDVNFILEHVAPGAYTASQAAVVAEHTALTVKLDVVGDVIKGIGKALPFISVLISLKNGDYEGAMVTLVAIAAEMPVIGWIYAGIKLIQGLMQNDDPQGEARLMAGGADGTDVWVSANGELGGEKATKDMMQAVLLKALGDSFATATGHAILVDRVPTLHFQAASTDLIAIGRWCTSDEATGGAVLFDVDSNLSGKPCSARAVRKTCQRPQRTRAHSLASRAPAAAMRAGADTTTSAYSSRPSWVIAPPQSRRITGSMARDSNAMSTH